MLQGLFGNNNVARILLFLFVNERGYACQIHSLLQVPLTPLQKAFLRLEKERIVNSHLSRKIRFYQLNPHYPLRSELEMLLKKAYTLLSPQEKKRYCFIHRPRLLFDEEVDRKKLAKNALAAFWDRLQKVRHLSFSAETEQTLRIGQGEVEVLQKECAILIFEEKGRWNQPDIAFSNRFRWTLDMDAALITLEHLRYGLENPVFLFHLTPTQPFILESVDAHLCGEDTYLGNIIWNKKQIAFRWRVIGPLKNDHLTYHYI